MKTTSLSIILPTFKEKDSIIRLIMAIHDTLEGYKHEILIVDDNSPDGTYQAVVDAQLPYARGILRTTDRGFAKSIRCGIENANGDVIIIMDSDFNHQPKYLPFMVDSLRYYDCVSASRFVYGGLMEPRSRHLMSWIFNLFVRGMTGGKVTDNLYGFFAIRKDVLFKTNFDQIFWGYGDYGIRLIYFLQKINSSILQFPAENGTRIAGVGNSRLLKVFAQYFREVCILTYKIRIKKNV